MNRREMLRRLPALPLAAGAAIAQGPQVVMRLFAGNPYRNLPAAEEIAPAMRVQWFTQFVEGWGARLKPNVPLPDEAAEMTPAITRAWLAWSQYIRAVADNAMNNRIPSDVAAEIAGVPERLLQEVMH